MDAPDKFCFDRDTQVRWNASNCAELFVFYLRFTRFQRDEAFRSRVCVCRVELGHFDSTLLHQLTRIVVYYVIVETFE